MAAVMNPGTAMNTDTATDGGDEARWNALCARDAAWDGRFLYGVVTTGVYCRPSCAARRPRRENVRFFATGDDARAAGFRACKRCRPDANGAPRHAELIARICRDIEQAGHAPDLAELAAKAGMSRHHFHRVFKSVTGVTPRAYVAGARNERLREALDGDTRVTDAAYASGFNSAGRFYAATDDALGMTPGAWRSGGDGMQVAYAFGSSTLGVVLVAATERGLCAVSLGDDQSQLLEELRTRFHAADIVAADSAFDELVQQVVALVEAPSSGASLPLDLRGTAFQRRVWAALRRVPAGQTASYADIARAIDQPEAARAVARACAANPVAVAVPCHRVVRGDGSLSGYRWGVARKRALLEREGGGGDDGERIVD